MCNSRLWKMNYCKEHGLAPASSEAWTVAEEAWLWEKKKKESNMEPILKMFTTADSKILANCSTKVTLDDPLE